MRALLYLITVSLTVESLAFPHLEVFLVYEETAGACSTYEPDLYVVSDWIHVHTNCGENENGWNVDSKRAIYSSSHPLHDMNYNTVTDNDTGRRLQEIYDIDELECADERFVEQTSELQFVEQVQSPEPVPMEDIKTQCQDLSWCDIDSAHHSMCLVMQCPGVTRRKLKEDDLDEIKFRIVDGYEGYGLHIPPMSQDAVSLDCDLTAMDANLYFKKKYFHPLPFRAIRTDKENVRA